MPVTELTENSMLFSSSGAKIVRYPDPFFDLANNYIPKNIKSLFKFCRNFFFTNSFLRNVITKLTEYPITDILYDTALEEKVKNDYDVMLNDKLKIKPFLIEIGLDYFTMGNVFISLVIPAKRFLKCSVCGEAHTIESIPYKFKNYSFYGVKCPSCKTENVLMHPQDEIVKSADNLKFVRWAPDNIDIEYNPITGSATYYYTIPNKIKNQIIAGNKTILKDIPLAFLDALKLNKKLELDKNNFYHMKYPTIAEEDMGWGKPMILPALKDIYYLQTLRRGNEAIVHEHLVPKKVISPASNGTIDPYSQMNLGQWKSEVQDQVSKWKIDPNHIAIFPIPMQYQELGGNAKMLMLTPEMRFLEETIINSLGVPLEFIKGGTSWTGSSVSLRIVENHFLTYRELLLDFLNYFLIPKLATYLNYPRIKVHFKKFKMSDDSESKQLLIQLNSSGKIDDRTLHEEFGLNHYEIKNSLNMSRTEDREEAVLNAEKQAEAQGRAQMILAKYQARAQKLAQDEIFKYKVELFEDELQKENEAIPEDPFKLIDKLSIELLNLPGNMQSQKLLELSRNMPTTYTLVLERLNQFQTEQLQGPQQIDIATVNQDLGINTPPGGTPPNQKNPGERRSDRIRPKPEKKVGNKTGEPKA